MRRCRKENETALVRPRFRSFASHLRALKTKPPATQATTRQPYLNFDCTLLSEGVFRPPFFLFLNPFLSLFFLFHLDKKFYMREEFRFLEIVNLLTSVKQNMKILGKVVENRRSFNLPSVFLPAVSSIE